MNLIVRRDTLTNSSYLGTLAIDGTFFGYTLEDLPRKVKIQNVTCIPAGKYFVKVTFSNRFQKRMPLVYNNSTDLNVETNEGVWAGIRFHGGNTELDTDGCILIAGTRHLNEDATWLDKVNHKYVKIKNWIQGSLADKLTSLLDNGQVHNLTIIEQ